MYIILILLTQLFDAHYEGLSVFYAQLSLRPHVDLHRPNEVQVRD